MAGLTTAWELSRPEYADQIDRITVYQRDHQLGGKGASGRGVHGRIEEHGLHVWLGYYDNAFRLMRECYGELDRERTNPDCPIRAWTDAFVPAGPVGVAERVSNEWSLWLARFSANTLVPGDPDPEPLTAERFVRRGLQLIVDFIRATDSETVPGLYFSASNDPSPLHEMNLAFSQMLRTAEVALMSVITKLIHSTPDAFASVFADQIEQLRSLTQRRADADPAMRRVTILIDLITTCFLGMTRDRVAGDLRLLEQLDDQEFTAWLHKHGATKATTDSALVRGLYDLVFAFEEGDPDRRSFPAGLGLFLTAKIFFDYKGSIFWKMTAGMGDVVFAPLYEALIERGVRFKFFHRIEMLVLAPDKQSIAAIELATPAERLAGTDEYKPLVSVGGLPCFPSEPIVDRRPAAAPEDAAVRLVVDSDFDDVVIATSIGALPHIAAELITHVPGWSEMIKGVPTVATQAFQVWFDQTENQLGAPEGATISGYDEPFDTYASMSHVLPLEAWESAARQPLAVSYFCSPLPNSALVDKSNADVAARVDADAATFLRESAELFYPNGYVDGSLQEDHIVDVYSRANIDPSDRYVRSQPGSTRTRLAPGASGLTNAALAGDWTDCGLNAGCIEAATLSGIQAANAIVGKPHRYRVLATWLGTDEAYDG